MNQTSFPKLSYVLLLFVLVACQAQATSVPTTAPILATAALLAEATTIPPTTAPKAATPTPKVIAEWKIVHPEDIVFGFDSVWVPSRRSPNETTRIDPVTNQIVTVINGTGYLAKSAAVTDDAVWVAGQSDDLAPIDPATNTVGTKIPGNHPRIAFGFGSIWAVGHQGEPLDRVNPATSTILASIPLGGKVSDSGEENGVWITSSAVWVFANNELIKIDPATNSISSRIFAHDAQVQAKAQTDIPSGKGTDFLWLLWNGGLLRLDPNTGVGLTFLPLGFSDGGLAITDESVWVSNYNGNQLERINIATNAVDQAYTIDHGATAVAAGLGSVWLAFNEADLVQRLDVAP